MATKEQTTKDSDRGLHVTEGVGGVWHYHLSVAGTNATGLCGARTMHTSIPLERWGHKGHLPERHCQTCEREGLAELKAAGAKISVEDN